MLIFNLNIRGRWGGGNKSTLFEEMYFDGGSGIHVLTGNKDYRSYKC